MRRSNFTAWLLIFAGSFLLLNYFDVLEFNRAMGALLASLFLSAVFIQRALVTNPRRGLIGSTFFILLSLMLIGMQAGFIPVDDRLGGGLLLVSLGLANLVCYFVTRYRVSNLIWGFIFILAGTPFLIGYFEWLPLWMVEDYYTTYWPALLIFIGVVVLIDGIRRKRKQQPENSYHK